MKRLIVVVLIMGLVGCAGCGEAEVPAEPSTMQTTEGTTKEQPTTEETTTTKYYPPPVPPETVNADYSFTSSYAKTPTYFFAVKTGFQGEEWYSKLYRTPLRDISKKREIVLPNQYEGHTLRGHAICGITEKELFVSRSYSDTDAEYPPHFTYVTYRITLEKLDVAVVDAGSYYCDPWYNAATASLLFVPGNTSFIRLETLRLEDNKREVLFEDTNNKTESYAAGWHATKDGMAIFENVPWGASGPGSDYIVIDSTNRAVPMAYDEIDFSWPEAQSKIAAGDKFCVLNVDSQNEDSDGNYIGYQAQFLLLDENGNTVRKLADGREGEDDSFFLALLDGTGMIMMLHESFWNVGSGFKALYDPATGAVFS